MSRHAMAYLILLFESACSMQYVGSPFVTHLTLPPGTWRGSENAPGASRRVDIETGTIDIGTGAFVWNSGKVLCDYLGGCCSNGIVDSSVLELGCGTGAVGIFAAGLGASRVLLTDGGGDDLLELAQRNVRLNKQLYQPNASVEVEQYNWGDPPSESMCVAHWDWILASDVTYAKAAHELLCASLRNLLRSAAEDESSLKPLSVRPPRVLIAHQNRIGDPKLNQFYACAEAHQLQVAEIERVVRQLEGDDEKSTFTIFELSL